MAGGLLWPTRLGVALFWLAAPLLILGAGTILLATWRNPDLGRWGRAVCTSGVAAYLVFLVAVVAGGDVEGGIPVGAQAFWQTVWIVSMMAAAPMLIAGGALLLLRRARVPAA